MQMSVNDVYLRGQDALNMLRNNLLVALEEGKAKDKRIAELEEKVAANEKKRKDK